MKIRDILTEGEAVSGAETYRGGHEAPDRASGAPLFNLCANGIYPDDVYGMNGFRYYANTGEASDAASFALAMRYHNKPNAPVKIYRAVPKDPTIKTINPGDWVAISRRYCAEHGRAHLRNSYKILSKIVFARDVYTDGNISEWGYEPTPRDVEADKARKRKAFRAKSPEDQQAYLDKYWPPEEHAKMRELFSHD